MSKDADINIKKNESFTALMVASQNENYDKVYYDVDKNNYLSIVKLILIKDCSLAKGKYLTNFILYNNNYISEYIFSILKKIGFNIENFIPKFQKEKEEINFNELYFFINKGNLSALEKIINLSKTEIFNFYFEDGKTFLHHLVRFPLLLGKAIKIEGVNLNINKGDGSTPSIDALMLHNLESLKLLIENKNLDINILFENNAPLMISIVKGNSKASEILLQREDIKIYLVNRNLKTALEIAIDFEEFEIATTILNKSKDSLIMNTEALKKLTREQLKLVEKSFQKNHISIYYKAFIEAAKKGKIELSEKSLDLSIMNSNEEEYLNDIFDIFIKNNDIFSFEKLLTKKKIYSRRDFCRFPYSQSSKRKQN